MIKSKKSISGQTIFELVMAIAVGVVIVTAIVAVATTSLRNSSFAKQSAEATRYAQETIEWLRTERDKSWTTFHSKAGITTQTYCLTSLSWPSGTGNCDSDDFIGNTFFKREVQLRLNIADETINALVTVTWDDGNGTHQSTLETEFSDWIIQ